MNASSGNYPPVAHEFDKNSGVPTHIKNLRTLLKIVKNRHFRGLMTMAGTDTNLLEKKLKADTGEKYNPPLIAPGKKAASALTTLTKLKKLMEMRIIDNLFRETGTNIPRLSAIIDTEIDKERKLSPLSVAKNGFVFSRSRTVPDHCCMPFLAGPGTPKPTGQ
ncbi:MAG: hypothetical protein H6868_02440 [Rhodospirillales bacterium]|nr:hypothetical protein [Rhodospirillales bacterium]